MQFTLCCHSIGSDCHLHDFLLISTLSWCKHSFIASCTCRPMCLVESHILTYRLLFAVIRSLRIYTKSSKVVSISASGGDVWDYSHVEGSTLMKFQKRPICILYGAYKAIGKVDWASGRIGALDQLLHSTYRSKWVSAAIRHGHELHRCFKSILRYISYFSQERWSVRYPLIKCLTAIPRQRNFTQKSSSLNFINVLISPLTVTSYFVQLISKAITLQW
jgi:hypothetical protein